MGISDDAVGKAVDLVGQLLAQGAAVGEDEGGLVFLNPGQQVCRQIIPDFFILTTPGGGLRVADADVIAFLCVARQHTDLPLPVTVTLPLIAGNEPGNHLKRIDRGGQGNALKLAAQGHQPFNGGHKVDAPPGIHHRMNFIQDDRVYLMQDVHAATRREHDVQAFRRGYQNLRGLPQHAPSLFRFRIAATHRNADVGEGLARRCKSCRKFGQRQGQVFADVIVQSLERTDIEYAGCTGFQFAGCEAVQGPEKGGQCFATAGRCGNQQMLTPGNTRPGHGLNIRRLAVSFGEPLPDNGMKLIHGLPVVNA